MAWRKRTYHEKQDLLVAVSGAALLLLVMFGLKQFQIQIPRFVEFFVFLCLACMMTVPSAVRRRKQFKRIKEIKDQLGISVEEMRSAIGVSRYDLVGWEKNKIYLQPKQWYQLEEYMENRFIEATREKR